MSYLIAAAGTGGHVYPGLAVGEALVAAGVLRQDVHFVGGERLESKVYPAAGFPFFAVPLRGLERRLTRRNLAIPRVVSSAAGAIGNEIVARGVGAVLGMGGYVTLPTAWAARRRAVPLFVAEQNADAGLANRVSSRWAVEAFTSFPETRGLRHGRWVGNPIRRGLASFDRETLRPEALARYGLVPDVTVVGVVGGSLGSARINRALVEMVQEWTGPDFQLLHLAGESNLEEVTAVQSRYTGPVRWSVLGFEPEMQYVLAASDLVVARAGGSVAELTATATPAVLVPGGFGSSGHQAANAAVLAGAGSARVVSEEQIGELAKVIEELILDREQRERMGAAATAMARPNAADEVVSALLAAHG
jgi:UDP-N-acetylglucosamine--N-acetylmuramyl-(pentapeptide) pyrophosphoryl-undecaprenol N-acetylglucosamine transferase